MFVVVAASLALLEDGSVWAWGSNLDGQLGTSGQSHDTRASSSMSEGQPHAKRHAVQSSPVRQSSGRPDPFRCLSFCCNTSALCLCSSCFYGCLFACAESPSISSCFELPELHTSPARIMH